MELLRIATHNDGPGGPDAKAKDFSRIAEFADIIGRQEGSDGGQATRMFLHEHRDWSGWDGDGRAGAAAVPFLWRRNIGKLTLSRSVTAHQAIDIGDAGVGPDNIKAKVYNWMRWDIPGFGRTHVFNTHMIVGSTHEELPNHHKRVLHYKDHIRCGCRLIRWRSGLVFYTADDNAEPDYRLLDPLRGVGMVQDVFANTHDEMCYDHVWHRQRFLRRRSVTVVKRITLRGLSSDHETPIVTYRRG